MLMLYAATARRDVAAGCRYVVTLLLMLMGAAAMLERAARMLAPCVYARYTLQSCLPLEHAMPRAARYAARCRA